MIVPKFKCILFGFHKISWFIAKVTFDSIPGNIEDRRMHIFLHLFDNLQTPKTRISFFGHHPQGFAVSIPLSGSFRNQDLEKITKNTVSFLPIKIGKVSSGHCRPNKEKRILTGYIRDGCHLPRWLRQDNRCDTTRLQCSTTRLYFILCPSLHASFPKTNTNRCGRIITQANKWKSRECHNNKPQPNKGSMQDKPDKHTTARLDSLVVERLLRVWEVAGSNPGRVIPKTKKWYQYLPCLALSIKRDNWLFFSDTLDSWWWIPSEIRCRDWLL